MTLIKHRTSTQPFKKPEAFVTTGPFRFSRNPVYLGMAIILLGFILILGVLSGLVFAALFILVTDRFVIPGEERDLEEQFGEAYHAYMQKVRRWF